MKLLVWFWGRRGGGPRYALELLRALTQRDDIELSVTLARDNNSIAEFSALPCAQTTFETYRDLPSFCWASARLPLIRREFRAFLERAQPEVVVSTMPHPWSWYLAPAVHEAGSKLISVIHDAYRHPGDVNPLWAWRLRRELAATEGVVALSQHVKQQLVSGYDYPCNRIATIPLGPFGYSAPSGTRRRFPRGRPFRFLFFGRFLNYKGIDLLLRAYRLIAAAHEGVELHLVGSGDLSSYRSLLEGLPRVTVINRWLEESELPDVLENADVLVAPYSEASQSAAIATAYGTGIPVVVTPIGGLVEQVVAGETGMITADFSPEAVRDSMEALLDPAVYDRCAEGVRTHARGVVTWRQTADDLVAYCRQILAGEATPA